MLYEVLRPVAGLALRWYYRSISVAGRSRVPPTGPVFFAVNHPNAMVDALVVATIIPRQVGFTAKSTIFANPLLAAFLHAVGVVPLKRAADMAKEAAKKAAENATSHSLTSAAAAGAGAANAPIDPSRNADSFRAVSLALADGKAIVVFPEGISHDAPHLAPLRTGLARMALQARESQNVRGIKIIPVGLLYERKEEPRSRILVQIGEPIDVDSFAANADSVDALTAVITDRLSSVTLNFETPEDVERIEAISETMAALLEPTASIADSGPSLSAVLAISRRAERVRQRLEGEATPDFRAAAAEFETRLEKFRDRLRSEKIVVEDLFIDVGATSGARFAIREALLAAVITPIALWGRLTHFIPLRLARSLAQRNTKNRDEPAMNTIVFGLVLVLASYAVQTALVWMLFGPEWGIVFLATLIPSASSDFRYGDRVERRSQRSRTYLRFRERPELRTELLAEADWLRRQAGVIEAMSQ